MQNELSKKHNPKSLILYSIPTILMMIFTATYTVVDGIFVSNFVNEDALAAVNIVTPIVLFIFAIGMMFAMGGSAVIARLLGEKKDVEARQFFSLIYLVGTVLGVIATILIFMYFGEVIGILGANAQLMPYTHDYLFYMALFIMFEFLQVFALCFFVTAGKPQYGFILCVIGGVANIAFDYIFMVTFNMGIIGAALATGIGFAIPGIAGVIYFFVCRKGTLYFVMPKWNGKEFFLTLYNGLSEFINTSSAAITTLIFNLILLKMANENGVAAISVILYIQMIQMAVYIGYSFGVAPVISYKFGEKNQEQIKLIMKTSVYFITLFSVITIACSLLFAEQAVGIFISESSPTFAMTAEGFRIFSFAYLFMGFSIFVSAMFTALSNGRLSATVSVLRSLVFIVIALLVLPKIMGITGVWLAVPIAEALTLIVALVFYKNNKKKYGY